MLKGIGTLCGVGIGKVFKYETPVLNIKEEKGEPEKELAAFEAALTKTVADIEKIKERASSNLKEEELAIFDAHLMMVNDPEYASQIKEMINEKTK